MWISVNNDGGLPSAAGIADDIAQAPGILPGEVRRAVSASPQLAHRVALALAVAIAVAGYCWLDSLRTSLPSPRDFDQVWFAARALLHHQNPYALIGPSGPFRWPWPFFYPMTAAVVVLPLAWLPVLAARLVFVAIGAGVFTWAITRDGWHRLPALLGGSFWVAVQAAQWSPLLTAAAITPALAWCLVAKPNVAIITLGAFLRPRVIVVAAVGGVLVLAVSLAMWPGWIGVWRAAVGGYQAPPLVTSWLGGIFVLALLRWRRADARLILLLGCVPHTVVAYEALPLALIAETRMESLVLAFASWCTWAVQSWSAESGHYNGPLVYAAFIVLLYLPALVIVLRRPNVSNVACVLGTLDANAC